MIELMELSNYQITGECQCLSIQLFSLLILSREISVSNLGSMFQIVVFIVVTVLAWPESRIPFKSSANSSDEFLSLFEILKCIWSCPGYSVIVWKDSSPEGVLFFETKLLCKSFEIILHQLIIFLNEVHSFLMSDNIYPLCQHVIFLYIS